MNSTEGVIGLLDSGVGGITVVREVMRQLPRERLVYFGDTVNCPYGPRPAHEVKQFTERIVRFLNRFSLKALVIACNTATAIALEEARQWVSVPVIGVIHPGARAAIKATRRGRIGVIGTEGTIKSCAYEQSLKQLSPYLHVTSLACPTLVPLVESGRGDTTDCLDEVQSALKPLNAQPIDTLILGCTHYPLLSKQIARVMGPNVTLINSAEETARELSTILHYREALATRIEEPQYQFFTSGPPETFSAIATRWLGRKVAAVQVSL